MLDMQKVFSVVDVYYIPPDLHLNSASNYTAIRSNTNKIFITYDDEEFIRAVKEESISSRTAKHAKMLYTSNITLREAYLTLTKDEFIKRASEYVLQQNLPVLFETRVKPTFLHSSAFLYLFRKPSEFVEFFVECVDDILHTD